MSTRSERYKSEAQRASSKQKRAATKAAAPKVAKKAAGKAAKKVVGTTAKKVTKKVVAAPLTMNASRAAGRKASFALEASAAQPSRKSTRASANRQKPDSNLKRRETRRTTSAKQRAARGK